MMLHPASFMYESESFGSSHHEQALLNYCIRKTLSQDVIFLSDSWNCINPDFTSIPMKEYIYHFTGCKWKLAKEAIKTYPWN